MEQIDYGIKMLETPCFILDRKELERSIEGFKAALHNHFDTSIVAYSVKTNSLPYCLSVAKELGCFAEVVSSDEYNLALLCGFKKNRIIYNGPMKSHDTFLDAVVNEAIVNIETHRELEWLKELPPKGNFKVGLRLNVNITKVSPNDTDEENDNSRFGFSVETEDFPKALEIINSLNNVTLAGLHIHRTAHSRSIRFYQNSISYACDIIHRYDLKLDYLDIGGGFFGIFPNKPTYQQYAGAFKQILQKQQLNRLNIVVEPGNALVASCFSFLSEVIDVKHVEKNLWFITTDGSRNDIDPFFRKSSYMTDIITEGDGEIVKEQIVSGCTCLEYDRLFSILGKPLLKVHDRIQFKNVGAYTMCLTPMFIRYIPNVYTIENNQYKKVREKWTAHEFIQKSMI